MKKITAVITLAIAASMTLTAYGATAQLDEQKPSGGGDVNAVYTESVPWTAVKTDTDGKGSVTLPDGTKVIIENADSTKKLVIDPITEQDAIEWINSILSSDVDNIKAYNVYYLDGKEVLPANDVKLTIAVRGNAVYSLVSEGKSSPLSADLSDNGLTFTTDGSPYYIIGTKKQDNTSSQTPDVSESKSDGSESVSDKNSSSNTDGSQSSNTSQTSKPIDNGKTPNTGVAAGAAALALLGGAAVISAAKGKEKRNDK